MMLLTFHTYREHLLSIVLCSVYCFSALQLLRLFLFSKERRAAVYREQVILMISASPDPASLESRVSGSQRFTTK